MDINLKQSLEKQGYYNLKYILNQGLCGLFNFIYTVGLVCFIDEHGYVYRYCYEQRQDAIDDINIWNGDNHPSGNWLKRKGINGDLRNENYISCDTISQENYHQTKNSLEGR